MKSKKLVCKKCGAEITGAKVKECPSCGTKVPSPIFKKWWFWVIIVLGLAVIGSIGADDTSNESGSTSSAVTTVSPSKNDQTEQTKYTKVDLQKLHDDLNENAMKAEATYQNMYVEVTGKIANFDSDGKYISIEPINADEWNFETTMCYIKKDAQREILMNKSKGDTVVIKGKIITIGEIIGYSINIDEVN